MNPVQLNHTFNTLFPDWTDLQRIAHNGHAELYAVGGSVRDAVLNRPLTDLDLVCHDRDMEHWEHQITSLGGGHFFTLGKEDRITRRLVSHGCTFDLTPMDGDSITADLKRRDFTINAMAVGLHDGSFHDPIHGLQALEQQQLLCVSPTSLKDDPLRILRAIRFSLTIDIQLPPETIEQMTKAREGLLEVAGERIGSEFSLILSRQDAATGIRLLAETRALFTLFSALLPLQGLMQNEYHHVDVLEHTLQVLENLDRLIMEPPDAMTKPDDEQAVILRWAALFHDVGKTLAKTIDSQTGKIHFYGHEQISAHLAHTMLLPLGIGKQTVTRIIRLIEQHLSPLLLSLANPKPKAFRKLVFAMEEDLPLLLFLTLADNLATRGKNFSQRQKKIETCVYNLSHIYQEERKSFIKPLINGKDLLALGLEPGPQMGVIIRAVHQRQINGECNSREEALAWVKNLLSPPISD
ncbi:MAG: HD domain-containing protein [Xanthomonadaceae bacterium]|nr:HD domain-containing protein [Xanthomonadaceae bacterium]